MANTVPDYNPLKLKGKLKSIWDFFVRTRWFTNKSHFRLAVLVVFTIITTLILPRPATEAYEYTLGQIWRDGDVIAPFDFPIRKDASSLEKEKERVLESVPAVFLLKEERQETQRSLMLAYFLQIEDALQQQRRLRQSGRTADLAPLVSELNPKIDPELARSLLEKPELLRTIEQNALALADTLYRAGYIDKYKSDLSSRYISLRSRGTLELKQKEILQVVDRNDLTPFVEARVKSLPPLMGQHIQQTLYYFVLPNYGFNEELTTAERNAVEASILPHYGVVLQDEAIVSSGEVVTQDIDRKLRSLTAEQMMNVGNSPNTTYLKLFGQLILVTLLVTMVAFFLRLNRRSIYYRRRGFLLLFGIYFLILLLVSAVQNIALQLETSYDLNFVFLVPMCMAPLMITVFFDDRVAYFSNTIISILAAIICQSNFEVFIIQMIAGSMVVFNLTRLKRRAQFFQTAGIALIAYMAGFLAYEIMQRGSLQDIPYENLVLFALNVAFTLGTYPLIYFIERIFGLTSDLTFMELLDTDHPLLKQLAQKAPGTYQHSLQVANIAEEVAKKIGANPIQVHVGALFHDIGKMEKPDYFTENQKTDVNPHDELTPIESAKIIIDHVIRGAIIAKEARLPEEIIGFIKTHHGTSRVEYFYRQHLSSPIPHPEEDESKFRYPGPLPMTKEMAIVMMSDSVEAAARCLDNPSSEDIKKLVEAIVTSKINDHQLEDAQLTFRDLNLIKKELIALLQSIHHTRIKYPDEVPQRPMVV